MGQIERHTMVDVSFLFFLKSRLFLRSFAWNIDSMTGFCERRPWLQAGKSIVAIYTARKIIDRGWKTTDSTLI